MFLPVENVPRVLKIKFIPIVSLGFISLSMEYYLDKNNSVVRHSLLNLKDNV